MLAVPQARVRVPLLFLYALVLLTFAGVLLVRVFLHAEPPPGQQLGGDFAAFYIAGQVLTEYGPSRLYDQELAARLYTVLFPAADRAPRPAYFNAPWLALLYAPLARLPYAWACGVWLVLSMGLYMLGCRLLWHTLPGLPARAERPGLLLALAFPPFLLECLFGGQTAPVGVFFLALAVCSEQRGAPAASGLALAGLLYKPTLLPVLLGMLVLTRRWRTLGGFGLGSLLVLGLLGQELPAWFATLMERAQAVHHGPPMPWKFVDLKTCALALWGTQNIGYWGSLGSGLALGSWSLLRVWRSTRHPAPATDWALALAWTPVFSGYFGVYDVPLLVVALLLVAAAQYQQAGCLSAAFQGQLALLYGVSLFSQTLAWHTGVQVYFLILVSFGIYVSCHARSCPWPLAPRQAKKAAKLTAV